MAERRSVINRGYEVLEDSNIELAAVAIAVMGKVWSWACWARSSTASRIR